MKKVYVLTLGRGIKEENERVSSFSNCLGVFETEESGLKELEKIKNEVLDEFKSTQQDCKDNDCDEGIVQVYGSSKEKFYELDYINDDLDNSTEIYLNLVEKEIEK